jgi:hypothetical protein
VVICPTKGKIIYLYSPPPFFTGVRLEHAWKRRWLCLPAVQWGNDAGVDVQRRNAPLGLPHCGQPPRQVRPLGEPRPEWGDLRRLPPAIPAPAGRSGPLVAPVVSLLLVLVPRRRSRPTIRICVCKWQSGKCYKEELMFDVHDKYILVFSRTFLSRMLMIY